MITSFTSRKNILCILHKYPLQIKNEEVETKAKLFLLEIENEIINEIAIVVVDVVYLVCLLVDRKI